MDFNLAPLPPGVAESDHPPVRHEQTKPTDRLNHEGDMAKTRERTGQDLVSPTLEVICTDENDSLSIQARQLALESRELSILASAEHD